MGERLGLADCCLLFGFVSWSLVLNHQLPPFAPAAMIVGSIGGFLAGNAICTESKWK
jgi:hypothetical protein